MLREAQVKEEVKLLVGSRESGFRGCDSSFLRFGSFRPLIFKGGEYLVSNSCFKGNFADHSVNLGRNGLLADIFLRARLHPLGAMQVVVSLLRLGRDEATAPAATEKPAIQIWFKVGRLGLALASHDCLHFIKQAFGNNGFVLSLKKLSFEIHNAVEKRVLKHRLIIRDGKPFTCESNKANIIHAGADFMECVVARRVKLEGFTDKRSFRGVNDDATLVAVVEIADGRTIRPDAIAEFLADAAFDVFRKIVHIVFALAKRDIKHELSMRGWFKAEGGKAKVADFSGVNEVNNPPAVNAVAGKTVGMPSEDSLSFAFFNLGKHEIKLWTPRSLRRAAF